MFRAVSVTRMTGLNGGYIKIVNQRWPWQHYGFYKPWYWSKPCGEKTYDNWGCWIYTRPWGKHWQYLGYDRKIVTNTWEHWYWATSGYTQYYTKYKTVTKWEVVKPAYTTTGHKQVLVSTSGWRTITQNVWVGAPTKPGTPTKWYAVAIPQWMANWGYNPTAYSGAPNPGTIPPGPTSPGPHNGGHMVQETTRYWGTWDTVKTVAYTIYHPAVWGWVNVQQSYTASRWINTSHWVWHWVTKVQWVPAWGWVSRYPYPGNGTGWFCTHWYWYNPHICN